MLQQRDDAKGSFVYGESCLIVVHKWIGMEQPVQSHGRRGCDGEKGVFVIVVVKFGQDTQCNNP